MTDQLAALRSEIEHFRTGVPDVATKRDLWTATERGAELNRIVSRIDRMRDELSPQQTVLLELAHRHVRDMIDCPRRMRLDSTWQDDFVTAALKAAEALVSLVEVGGAA